MANATTAGLLHGRTGHGSRHRFCPAQISDNVVKIGVLVDMSGVYSANGGPGAVTAVQMAVEDFGRSVAGKPIEVVSADYQNKVDITSSQARRWYDTANVDMIIESTDSASAIALQNIGRDKNGLRCSPARPHRR